MLKLIILVCVLYLVEKKLLKNDLLDKFCDKYFVPVMAILTVIYAVHSVVTLNFLHTIISIIILYTFFSKKDTIF